MNPRLRRLTADFAQIQEAFSEHPVVRLLETSGNPPENYQFELAVDGLALDHAESVVPATTHQVEIFLPLEYPRRAPFCRMLSPVYHPNIDPTKICIGDHWSSGQTLPSLILQIAEMIGFQSYNTRSPLNAKAAAWTELNLDKLPTDRRNLGGI